MLDCETPKGRVWLEHQERAIDVVCMNVPNLWAMRATELDSPWDCVFLRGEGRIAQPLTVAEVKSRDEFAPGVPLTQQLIESDGYLITEEKIRKLYLVSREMECGSSLVVNLINCRKVLVMHLSNAAGENLCEVRTIISKTKKTCNGGEVIRRNALVFPKNMRVYPY
jgi:hypothetical protein